MRFFIAAAPSDTANAASHCRALAHAAYRIGPENTLLRQNSLRTKGGLLFLNDQEAPPVPKPELLCAAAVRECRRQGFSGVVLDFEKSPRRDLLIFAKGLEAVLWEEKKTLYLPEVYAAAGEHAVLLICTALSGGNYTQRLREAIARYGGAGRLALDVQRLRMDFALPAPSGEGIPMSGEELRHLMEQEQPTVFFSQDLCARYFTYARDGQAHFVLFDDAETMNRKTKIGAGLGFTSAFFMWPEVKDIAGKLTLR